MTGTPQGFSVEANERARAGVAPVTLAEVQRQAMDFVTGEAGFAQVFTINAQGFPVGRTMGALVQPDWSVQLIQRRVHRRLRQWRRDPRTEIVWTGGPAPGSVNDRPHVFDFGLLVPRVVFLRGIAQFMDDSWTIEQYRLTLGRLMAAGHVRAPQRDADEVRRDLAGVLVRRTQVRAEGFAVGAQSYTWKVADHG